MYRSLSSLSFSPSTCYRYRYRTVVLRAMPMLTHTGHAHVHVNVIVIVLTIKMLSRYYGPCPCLHIHAASVYMSLSSLSSSQSTCYHSKKTAQQSRIRAMVRVTTAINMLSLSCYWPMSCVRLAYSRVTVSGGDANGRRIGPRRGSGGRIGALAAWLKCE